MQLELVKLGAFRMAKLVSGAKVLIYLERKCSLGFVS